MLAVRNTAAANNKPLTAGHDFAVSQEMCAYLPLLVYVSLTLILLTWNIW